MVFVTPVGPYFKEGFSPVKVQIARDVDRAAPLGTGRYKVGGNYAASMKSGVRAHDEGYAACLYLDAIEKKYIDEAGPANFFGIKDNTYITPKSDSILPSITNKSLQQIAKDMGMEVEVRFRGEGTLAFEQPGATAELVPRRGTRFGVAGQEGITVEFVVEDGSATGIVIRQSGQRLEGERVSAGG